METMKLTTRSRSGSGKSYTRKARVDGWIPAVYYGNDMEPVKLEVPQTEFTALLRQKKARNVIDLFEGDKKIGVAVIKELQRNPIKDDVFYHIDFMNIDVTNLVTVDCPVHTAGQSVGVLNEGGNLNKVTKTVSIECLPHYVPKRGIIINVSNLHLNDTYKVSELSLENITIKTDGDTVLAEVVA